MEKEKAKQFKLIRASPYLQVGKVLLPALGGLKGAQERGTA
jgi:hypothetical protein